MKLRSPEAFWLLKNGLINSYPSLQEDIKCDIAVVGAGITGALISHTLHRAGYNTVVIDKRDVGAGSSSATTSLLQYEIDTPMIELAKMIGVKGAVECYKEGVTALQKMKELIKKHKLDGGYVVQKSLQVSHSRRNLINHKAEYLFRKKHGFNVEWLSSGEIKERFGMNSFDGILSAEGGSIDAFKLAHELFSINHKRGLRIFDHTATENIKFGDRVTIETKNGHTVTCKKIVFCSGFETLGMFRKKYADIVTTFATLSEQNPDLPAELKKILIWETGNPYVYIRTTDDNRLLTGGEDVIYKYSRITEKLKNVKAEKLKKKTVALLPGIRFTEDYHWAGAFAQTKDGLPYIGEHSDYPNAIFVLGFGGNGITFSVQGMRLVLKILAHEHDPLLYYYRFNR